MEEECDSRDQSEDDSSPTDTSEDSVEVRVNRIYLPGGYPRANINPIDLRKVRSASPKTFEPLDFSLRQLKTVNRQIKVCHSTSGVADGLAIKHMSPVENRDRKYSRRKASDPRRLLSSVEKRTKRCLGTTSIEEPPSKVLRQSEKSVFDKAAPSTSFNKGSCHGANEPSAFQPLFLSALHPLIGYPYSQFVKNVVVPPLSLLTQGLHSLPYAGIQAVPHKDTPPIDTSNLPNSSPFIELDNRGINQKKCDSIVVNADPNDSKAKSDPNIRERFQCNQNINSSFLPIKTEGQIKEPQDKPIDYSLTKFPCPKHTQISYTNQETSKNGDGISVLDLRYGKQKQRNYKNMTRERRIEANARERTRVHAISAAFEKLRLSVPSDSNNQKLSKLAVIRIACAYILSLSRSAGLDDSFSNDPIPMFAECVDRSNTIIQKEGTPNEIRDS